MKFNAWLLGLAALTLDVSAADLSTSTVQTLPLRGGVHLVRTSAPVGNPSGVALTGPDGVLLVDTGFSQSAAALRAAVAGLGNPNINYVINTHPHGDHTLGNEVFGPHAMVVARSQLRARSMQPGVFGPNSPPLAAGGLPDLVVDSHATLYLNAEQVELLPQPPGHTDGDMIVYFKTADVLAVGDYFFLNRWPIVDEGYGGSLTGYMSNIEALLATFPDSTIVVPGHPSFDPDPLSVTTVADWRQWHGQLVASITHITARRAAGATLEQVQAEGLPEALKPLGQQPAFVSEPKWIEHVYASWPAS